MAKPRTNHDNCKCFICKYGREVSEEFERESLEKYGWYAHMVTDNDPQSPTGVNIHTHALAELWNHPDFQCVFPIDPRIVMTVWHQIINDIKKGKFFEANIDYEGYLQGGYKIRFIEAKECGRQVLRMLICDKEGKYEGGNFAKQLEV